jgi:hypothetical protein
LSSRIRHGTTATKGSDCEMAPCYGLFVISTAKHGQVVRLSHRFVRLEHRYNSATSGAGKSRAEETTAALNCPGLSGALISGPHGRLSRDRFYISAGRGASERKAKASFCSRSVAAIRPYPISWGQGWTARGIKKGERRRGRSGAWTSASTSNCLIQISPDRTLELASQPMDGREWGILVAWGGVWPSARRPSMTVDEAPTLGGGARQHQRRRTLRAMAHFRSLRAWFELCRRRRSRTQAGSQGHARHSAA